MIRAFNVDPAAWRILCLRQRQDSFNNKSLFRIEGIAEQGDSGVGIKRLFNRDWPVFHLLVSFPPTEPQRSLLIDTHVLDGGE